MKIKETYIVKEGASFIKLHYCINSQGSCIEYYKEYKDGVILKITNDEFFKLLKDY